MIGIEFELSRIVLFVKVERSVAETATALQLSFEEAVVESYNLYEIATKGKAIVRFIGEEMIQPRVGCGCRLGNEE